jgi:hypothetical protein
MQLIKTPKIRVFWEAQLCCWVSTTHTASSRTTALHEQLDTEDNDTAGFRNVRKYQTTQRHISEDLDLQQHCCENLKSHINCLHSLLLHILFEFQTHK